MTSVETNKLTSKYRLIDTGMRNRWRVGKLKRTGIEGYHPIRIAIRWTNPFHREVGLKDRIERRVKSEGPRIHSDVDGERILPKTEVIVRCVRKGVQTVQVCEKVGRQFAAGNALTPAPSLPWGVKFPVSVVSRTGPLISPSVLPQTRLLRSLIPRG